MERSVYDIDPSDPAPSVMDRAARVISTGGVVLFPTQSLYGLAANALDPEAVNRVFKVKARPAQKPVLVLIDHVSKLDALVREIPPAAFRIMDSIWPGGVTLVCFAAPDLPPNLTAGTGKIGIRLPVHPVARQLVRRAKAPVTGTSANLSGSSSCARVTDIDLPVRRGVDMILNAGELKGGVGSTILDVTTTPPTILREGAVPRGLISDAIAGPIAEVEGM